MSEVIVRERYLKNGKKVYEYCFELAHYMKGAKEEGEQNPDLPQNVKQELQDGRHCMNMRMLVR